MILTDSYTSMKMLKEWKIYAIFFYCDLISLIFSRRRDKDVI